MSARPTIRDVAEAAGVSIATVSLVLRGLGRMSDHTREHVLAAADSLGYTRNRRAIAFRDGRSRFVALVLAQYRNADEARAYADYWGTSIYECATVLSQRGYALALIPPGELEILDTVAVDLALVADPDMDDSIEGRLREMGIPLGSGMDESGPGVRFDIDYPGMMDAVVAWLREQGSSKPLVLAPEYGILVDEANIDMLVSAWSTEPVPMQIQRCGFAPEDIRRAYVDAVAQGCDSVVSLVAGQAMLDRLAADSGAPAPGVIPTVFYEDARALLRPGTAMATVSPSELGRQVAHGVADYLDKDRAEQVIVQVPFTFRVG